MKELLLIIIGLTFGWIGRYLFDVGRRLDKTFKEWEDAERKKEEIEKEL